MRALFFLRNVPRNVSTPTGTRRRPEDARAVPECRGGESEHLGIARRLRGQFVQRGERAPEWEMRGFLRGFRGAAELSHFRASRSSAVQTNRLGYSFGIRSRLIISEPESANIRTSG